MSIMDKIKELFSSGSDTNNTDGSLGPKDTVINFSDDMVDIIHVNPNVYLAHRGARICIGKGPIDGTINDQMNNISKVLDRGHESVSEHTNGIALWRIPKSMIASNSLDYSDLMCCTTYLKLASRETDGRILLLIGGSLRAWMHLLREMTPKNVFRIFVQTTMYNMFEKCLLGYAIKNNLLDESKCTYLCDGKVETVKSTITQVKNKNESTEGENYDEDCEYAIVPEEVPSDHVDLIYKSPANNILAKIKDYGFTLKDVYHVATVTLLFHDISRTCSHQLVRHRNGVSQESQRYVTHDYNKDTDFVDPIKMNLEERYSGKEFKDVLDRINEVNPFKMYYYLMSNKVFKEDARAWLPSNVTTQLIMTFTYENFAKFLELRMDKAAQKEIRLIAEEAASVAINPEAVAQFIAYTVIPIGIRGIKDGDPLLAEFDGEINTDEVVSEKPVEQMVVKSDEDAQKLFDLQEKYSKPE